MIAYFYWLFHILLGVKTDENIFESSFSYAYNGNSPLHHYKANIVDIPYHVLIAYNRLYCSGALIRSKVVVTAASCFLKWHVQRIVVKVGSETVTGLGQVLEVIEVKKHEYFGHNSVLDNDIALLMLNEHVEFGPNVMKIIMIDSDRALEGGTTVEVSGWGYAGQQSAKYANNLLWSEMTILSTAECSKYYPNIMTNSNFCAKYSVDRRLSDNGGPAVFHELLVGVLSFGAGKHTEPFIAILTNVSYFHRWISLNANRFMMKYCVEQVTEKINYEIHSDDYGMDGGWI